MLSFFSFDVCRVHVNLHQTSRMFFYFISPPYHPCAAQDQRKEERSKMSPEVALNRISPALSPFISSVVRNGKVGLDATNCLRITDLKSG